MSEPERSITTIAVRLGKFRALTQVKAKIPDDLAATDAEQLASEAMVVQKWTKTRDELKGDLKWLFNFTSIDREEAREAAKLFDQIVEVI